MKWLPFVYVAMLVATILITGHVHSKVAAKLPETSKYYAMTRGE